MDQLKLPHWLRKYRFVLAVVLIGMALLLLPEDKGEPAVAAIPADAEKESIELRLEKILSRMDGAGEVAVMLTELSGEQIIYQSDGVGADTVVITDAGRNQQGLIHTRKSPVYRGAVVVCSGADSPAVRLAVVEAVSSVTGLGADKITVLKMK